MRADFGSERPDRRTRVARTSRYTKYAVRYPSGDLTISGILYVPRGDGPFPGIVLNHGYIEPSTYFSGQGMPREQEYLARRGFVVLHTDYRGHAQSSKASALERELRLGYTEDAINAVYALQDMPQVNPKKVAMFGRSMGGGVTYNALVTAPGLVRCGVVWAPVSSSFTDNYNRWTRPERGGTADQLTRRWGEPDDDKPFYADLSARTFFDRITEPLHIEHGTVDRTCPIRWSERTVTLLKKAGAKVDFDKRRGEDHTFYRRWTAAMDDTHDFLKRHLDL